MTVGDFCQDFTLEQKKHLMNDLNVKVAMRNVSVYLDQKFRA